MLVSVNTAANTNPMIPIVPVMMPEKYNPIITAAITNRITLSALPMFFFMIYLWLEKR